MKEFFSINKQELKILTAVFVIWRAALFFVSTVASYFLEYKPSFPYAYDLLAKFGLPQWLYSWAGFDGVHYITIAQKGYVGTALIQAFFPIYPLSMRLLSVVTNNEIISGLLISNLASYAFILVFFSLVKTAFSSQIAWKSIVLFLLFPTSFFMGAVYNESLFLLLVALSFSAAQRKNWFWAGIFAGIASATRIVGIFVMVGLALGILITIVINLLETKKKVIKVIASQFFKLSVNEKTSLFCIALGALGMLGYMLYLWYTFNDPLYFAHVQSEFGAGREERLVLLPQTLWRGLKIIMSVPLDIRFLTYFQELFFTCLVLMGLLVGFRKKVVMPYSWLIYALLAVLLPTTTGTLSSMPRYVLVAFPFFVILAQLQLPKLARYTIYGISGALLLWNTMVFIQGYWVA